MKTHFTKDNKPFTIRRPIEDDAQAIIDYSKVLFSSTDQVLTSLQEYTITVVEEKTWIRTFSANPNALLQIAVLENQIVGLLFFSTGTKLKNSHTGEFGVSVHPKYQRLGIGRALIETLLGWARSNRRIEKVFLQVFASNTNAIKLYEQMGFTAEDRHVKAIKQFNGDHVDIIQMYIETNSKK